MAALKIFAALFVVCIAQASAATISIDKPFYDETEVESRALGLRNPLSCISNFPETYYVIQELRGLWLEYQDIRRTNDLLKTQCNKMTDPAAKEQCLKDADEATAKQNDDLLEKTKNSIPRVAKLLWSYKECLFG